MRVIPVQRPTITEVSLLTPEERRRGGSFRSARAADDFLAGRVALRRFAAEIAGVPADSLTADYWCGNCRARNPDHGMPRYRLPNGDRGPLLSLSRADGWAVLAGIGNDGGVLRLGIDVERRGRADFAGFDELVLTPRERRVVRTSGDAGSQRAIFWARKEAFLKATGSGLRRDPATVETTAALVEGVSLTDVDLSRLGLPADMAVVLATGRV